MKTPIYQISKIMACKTMGNSVKNILCSLVVIVAISNSLIAQETDVKGQTIKKWLVLGPIPQAGDHYFYKDLLTGLGGESRVVPMKGDTVEQAGPHPLIWKSAEIDKNEFLNLDKVLGLENRHTGIAYAFARIESDRDKLMPVTLGHTGSLRVWLNGELIHQNRISRKPESDKDVVVVALRKGVNRLLVKVQGRAPYWGFYFKLYPDAQRLFINKVNSMVPDFRIGERVAAWGQIELVNVRQDSLREIQIELVGTELVYPCHQTFPGMAPGEVRRLPFWIATRDTVPQGEISVLRLKVSSSTETLHTELTPRLRKEDEYYVTTYLSKLDGSVQPYSVLLPTSYTPERSYPLVLLLHGAWVTGWGQNIISYNLKEWIIQVAVHDRGNNRYRDVGEVDLYEVLEQVTRDFNIDKDRIYLAGHSMGGYGTWFQATRHPDRWAAISPQAGYADYFIYHPVMRASKDMGTYQSKLLQEWSPLLFAENLLHVPAYIIHGASDENVTVEHSRKMATRLQELGYTYVYDENPEKRHWWGPRGKFYGVEVVDKPPIWNFFQKYAVRKKNPRRVIYKTNTLRYNKAYWVTIDELDRIYELAQITAQISDDNQIEIQTSNITQFTLELNNTLIKPDLPVKVHVNGQLVYAGPVPDSRLFTLRQMADEKFLLLLRPEDLKIPDKENFYPWTIAAKLNSKSQIDTFVNFSPPVLQKSSKLFGPLVDAFNSKFLFVVGTGDETSQAVENCARRIARALESLFNGNVKIKPDHRITQEDINEYNLVLFGTPASNHLIARINQALPIRFSKQGIVFGEKKIVGEDLGMVMIYPNPLNQRKYVVIMGGFSVKSLEHITHLPLTELPDYVIFDHETLEEDEFKYIEAGFFNKYWQLY